jgi:hypothetical protein
MTINTKPKLNKERMEKKQKKTIKEEKGKCIVCGSLTHHKGRFVDDPDDEVGYLDWCCEECWEDLQRLI